MAYAEDLLMDAPPPRRPDPPTTPTAAAEGLAAAATAIALAQQPAAAPVPVAPVAPAEPRVTRVAEQMMRPAEVYERLRAGRVGLGGQALERLEAAAQQAPKRIAPAGRLERSYKGDEETVLPTRAWAKAFEDAGLPGLTFAKGVVPGESAGRPGAVGDDAAAGFGNTFGYGGAQITPRVQSDETLAKWAAIAGLAPSPRAATSDDVAAMKGPHESYFTPSLNAAMAKTLYTPGSIGSTWYGYDPSVPEGLHYRR